MRWHSHHVVCARESKKQAAVDKGLVCRGQGGGRGKAQGKVEKRGMEFGFSEGSSGEPRLACGSSKGSGNMNSGEKSRVQILFGPFSGYVLFQDLAEPSFPHALNSL